MHCIMCPPRGIYDKSIGRPLHEIYPDDKLREDQLRHMCSWHSGEVKRTYHPRGMYARGCTEGVSGRSAVGPSGFRTEHLGCSCGRRDRHGGMFDDATIQKMAADLNRKRRDPDLFTPASVCQRFGVPSADAALSPEEKLKKSLERARECQRRCNEYKKARRDAENAAAIAPAANTPKTSRGGDFQEGRLPQVTEGGEDTQTEVLKDEDPVSEDDVPNLSYTGRSSAKGSTGTSSTKLPYQSSINSPEGTSYPEEAGTEIPLLPAEEAAKVSLGRTSANVSKASLQGRSTVEPGRTSANVSKASLQGRTTPESGSERKSGTSTRGKSPDGASDPGSGKIPSEASGTSSKASQREESAPASAYRQSAGVNAQEGDLNKSNDPCAAVQLQCRCSMFNRGSPNSYPKQCTPQATSQPQYAEQNQYHRQNAGYPQEQFGHYGPQQLAQQYGTQNQQQQYGAQNQQQYRTQNQQQYGTQNQQQYGARIQQQQYGVQQGAVQGQQRQPYGVAVHYEPQSQQYGNMHQECVSQGQQYNTLVQQSRQYGPQSGIQDQQYPSGQGVSCPPCPPCGQAQGPQQQQRTGGANSNKQCGNKSPSVRSCTSSASPKRCSRQGSSNTYDGDDDEESKSGCKDLL